jgi:type I restriction enzyme S subunit
MSAREVRAIGVTRFKPYPAYKGSGVEWLGEIPAHWEVRRLKTIAAVHLSNVDKKSVEGQESVGLCNYVDVYYNDRITLNLDFMAATATPEQIRRFSLRAGDVLITKDSESWTDIAVPAVVTSDLPDVLCGYHLALVRPAFDCNGAFLARAFSAIGPRDQFQVAANGITRFGLGGDAIRTGLFAIPPVREQFAIAAFLDRETARIDALVGKKERLIELLQEKRTALITRAVTKGLDPNVPMKDSGVEWLGEIPAHWEVMRVRDIAESLQTGPFGSQLHSDEYVVGGTPVINPAHLQDEGIVPDWSSSVDDPTAERLGRHRLSAGDIVFARRGEVGRCALTTWEEEGWLCGTGSLRLRLRADVADPRFFVRMITTGGIRGWLALQSVGSTMQNLNTAIIGRIPVVVPPCSEQVAIADRLDHECERIRQLVGRIDNGIKRLKEFRTALISAAVTGKIDVREPRHSGGSRNPGREPA